MFVPKHVTSIRGKTYYWIHKNTKDVPYIVFTHGLCADHSMFEKQTNFFLDKYSIITWDIPLHGLSRPYKDFSYENAAKELHTILQNEKISSVILIGMSMGGYPCQLFVHNYPDMVTGFIGIDSSPIGLEYYSKSDLWWLQKTSGIMRALPDKLLRKIMSKGNGLSTYSRELMLRMIAPFSKEEICKQIEVVYKSFAKENRNIRLNLPVLLILGDHDKTGKVKQYNIEWAKKIDAPLSIIPNAAHMSNTDNPFKVNQVIKHFLKSLDDVHL